MEYFIDGKIESTLLPVWTFFDQDNNVATTSTQDEDTLLYHDLFDDLVTMPLENLDDEESDHSGVMIVPHCTFKQQLQQLEVEEEINIEASVYSFGKEENEEIKNEDEQALVKNNCSIDELDTKVNTDKMKIEAYSTRMSFLCTCIALLEDSENEYEQALVKNNDDIYKLYVATKVASVNPLLMTFLSSIMTSIQKKFQCMPLIKELECNKELIKVVKRFLTPARNIFLMLYIAATGGQPEFQILFNVSTLSLCECFFVYY